MSNNLTTGGRCRSLRYVLALGLVLPFGLGLVGCGAGITPLQGKVTANGKPVTGGTLIFSPVAGGKPASAEIKSDGTYAAGTNNPGDGAVVGKHRVTFTPPEQKLTDQQRTDPKYIAPPPLYMGMVPKDAEIEVKRGGGSVDVELVRGK